MDYLKIYNRIIARAKLENRKKTIEIYYEAHHIIPECLGGNKNKQNMVLLSAREHFICHWLLHNAFKTNKKLFYAFYMMCKVKNKNQNRYTPSSRIVEYAILQKNKMSIMPSGSSHYMFGKKHSEDTIQKMKISKKGCISFRKGKPAINRKQVQDLETGRIFESLLDASKYYKVSQSYISKLLKEKRKLKYYNQHA
jgi:hypothetical protein